MNILIGISGGIAAYKIPDLIRIFKKQGHNIKTVVTQNALHFVTPLTLETLSQHKIYADTFGAVNEYSTEHISLSDWADCFVIAPATANIIGKMANGIADDALSTAFLAFDKPVFVAPAMNVRMYTHAMVQANMQKLQHVGVQIIDATEGDLACGISAKGRMQEPSEIALFVNDYMQVKDLQGKKILITAGPTYEKIDPVRFIGNYSTGKMGFALAENCASRGAQVILLAGPVHINTVHPNIQRINVESAADMYHAATLHFPNTDGAILCAAVADFKPEVQANQKVKREKDNLSLTLIPTQDIAATLGKVKTKAQFLVGFALETNNEAVHAQEKMQRKNFDFIVLNSLQDKEACFGYDTNKVTIFHNNGTSKTFTLKDKTEVAIDIIDEIVEKYKP